MLPRELVRETQDNGPPTDRFDADRECGSRRSTSNGEEDSPNDIPFSCPMEETPDDLGVVVGGVKLRNYESGL